MDIVKKELEKRTQPHNIDAEQAVLGGLLYDWSAMAEIVTTLRPDRFYSIQNQIIYDALLKLYTKSIKGDTISLIDILTKEGKLEQAGGAAYIASLTQMVPSAANIQNYANIILDCSTRRELMKLAIELRDQASTQTGNDSTTLLDMAEQKIFALSERNETTEVQDMQKIIIEDINIIENHYKHKGNLPGIPTGIAKIDQWTSGLQKSELIIIGARPSIGKTALALSMMRHIILNPKGPIPCGFFSLEMPYQSIGMRLLSMESGVDMGRMRSGMLQTKNFQAIQSAAGRLYDAPLFTVDTPNMRLLDLRAMARRMVVNHHVQIIFIDYIGLITTENANAPVYEQVSEISKSLKALARELEIPIVALCQVARDAEGKEPNLAQLRGSGSIEQDADVVMFIDRERPKEESDRPQDAKIILAKQRNGPTGVADILFMPATSMFVNKAQE